MWTTEVFETARGTVPALVAGDGEPLVCWHGFPDLPHTFAPLAERLPGRRLIAPYQRGFHPDHPPAQAYFDAGTLAADAKALLDAVSPDAPVDVVGHDWGAAAVYGLVTAFPDRVSRAVTMALPPTPALLGVVTQPAQMRKSFYIWFFQMAGLPEQVLNTANGGALLDFFWATWSPGAADAPHVAQVREALAHPGVVEAALGYYRALFQPAFADPELGDVRGKAFAPAGVPVLLLGGDQDGCIDADILRAGGEWLPDGRVEILEGTGHFLHLEEPDRVASLIQEWLGS
ncbi:MAG TPA: alpha/beta fold hydrolase [Egibacteraceae bacterium]|nr:alpha/beta fold hydrolase [Egibacteraceae bacterium]